MIRTLRKRLTLLLISVITAVVLCTAIAILAVSEYHTSLSEQARFSTQVDQFAQDVGMGGILQSTQLAKIEVANDLVISIVDDGGSVPFHGGWQPLTDRKTLVSRAMASVPDDTERWNGSITGNQGERYLAAVHRVGAYRNARTVVMLEDMRAEDAQRRAQRLMYAVIALLALVVLSLFSWFFSGRAIRPVQDAYDKQNQFVAAASHELRTPMQVIRTASEALKLNPPEAMCFAKLIDNELSNMGKLTEDMLILTTAPNWKAVKGDPVDADALIQNAIENHSSVASQKGITLSFNPLPTRLPLLEGNELMLQRALNVLMDNAVCYTQPGGHVMVSVTLKPRTIEISIQDDGPGIAPEHRSRIFDSFYRTDKSRTDRIHSGLGLSIAKTIINNHCGQLTYASIKPHGSRFSMILPLIPKEEIK